MSTSRCLNFCHNYKFHRLLVYSFKVFQLQTTTMADKTESFYNKDSKIWHGEVVEPRFGRQDSIGSAVLESLLTDPDHISQICYESGKQLTNREMAELSIQVAQHFKKLELKQCDFIGMCTTNNDYEAALFFGAMLAGLSVYTVNPSYDKNGIKRVMLLTRPRIMFCGGDMYHTVRDAFVEGGLLQSSKIYTVYKHIDGVPNILEFFEEVIKVEEFRAPTLEKGPDQLAVTICTSGTTGIPKVVTISHAALLQNGGLKKVTFAAKLPNINMLCSRGLYGLNGLKALVHGTLDGATRIISEKSYTAIDFFDIVKRYKVNLVLSFPVQLSLALASDKLADSDLSSIQLYVVSGGTVAFSLIEKFKHWAPNASFVNAYGSSESCSVVTSGVCEPTNSMGKLNVNTEVKIVDDQGQHLGPHEIGEICIRTKFPWAGYLHNPEATKAVYDKNGWLHSGDVGYFNMDGQLYMVDRKSEILKYNMYCFAPSEIEKVILELPEVLNACVVGIPDSTYGDLPAAAVIKQGGSNIETSHIIQHVADRMQHFEELRGGVYFFDSLPQNASGKINRRCVTELCANIHTKS